MTATRRRTVPDLLPALRKWAATLDDTPTRWAVRQQYTVGHDQATALLAALARTPAAGPVDPRWRDRAACAGQDTRAFVPAEPVAVADIEVLARLFCDICPVAGRCREQAEHDLAEGLWAGQWRTNDDRGRPVVVDLTREDAA